MCQIFRDEYFLSYLYYFLDMVSYKRIYVVHQVARARNLGVFHTFTNVIQRKFARLLHKYTIETYKHLTHS